MQYRELGRTGIRVSAIGFGGWAIGGAAGASGAPLGRGRTSGDQALAAIRPAPAGEMRKDFSKQHIFHAVDGSLKRLRTDYIDLYQTHNPTIEELRREEIQEAMEMLQDAGKIRSWGVSISTPEEGLEIVGRGWAHTLQVLYNVLNQVPARELFPAARAKGYGIIARVPLASGLLTGKFRADSQFAADDVRQNFLTPRRLQEAVDAVDQAKAIMGGSARNLAEAALRFVLANEAVSARER